LSTTIRIRNSQTPRVSIIIPASSTQDLLLDCLRSLARFGPSGIAYETIVVLNESGADAAARLRELASGVTVIASPVNLGLAGSGNRARHFARGEHLVLLHDDAEIEPGWLEALVETADAHPQAGAVGGKVLFPDGRLQNAGMILWQNATTSPPWIGEAPPPTAFDRLRAVDYCGTSALLIRASALDAIGGFDERFYPVYYVDVDLSMALRARNFVVLYQPAARIRHHRGGDRSLAFRKFVAERNREAFVEKWAAALEAHEPPERGSRCAIERAIARAEAFATQSANRTRRLYPPPAPTSFDADAQDRRHLEKGHALATAFAAHQAAQGQRGD
jgi:GT2 family glycosyltransferase